MNISQKNPYIGPRTFLKEERHLFFGREREARDLLSLVVSQRLVLFYAQSGAGKSSIINTRLIPNLEERGYEVFPAGRVSGDSPPEGVESNVYIFNLMRKLIQHEADSNVLVKLSLSEFLANLDSDEKGYFYKPDLSQTRSEQYAPWRHALIIDQFEELFSTHPEAWEKREDFFGQLAAAMQDDPNLWVILVMREDYIASLDPYAHLLPGGLRVRYYMQRLGREAALKAIKNPVEALRPYAPNVAEKLVDDLCSIKVEKPDGSSGLQPGQYVEPVQLQVVCYSLWENLPEEGTQITEDDLREIGDVNQSLGKYYAGRVKGVAEAQRVNQRVIREWFEKKLITSGGMRNLVMQERKKTKGGLDDNVIHALQSDLVRAEKRGGATFYELTHDRLVEPIIADNKAWEAEHLSPLQRQAALWNDQARHKNWLLSGQALMDVERWAKDHPDEMTEIEEEFLTACRAEQTEREKEQEREVQRQQLETTQRLADEQARSARRARRFNWITISLFALALIAASLAIQGQSTAVENLDKANTAEVKAEAESDRAIAAEANARSQKLSTIASSQFTSNPSLSILLSLQAFQTDENYLSYSTLLAALQKFSSLRGFLNPELPPDEVQFGPQNKIIASRDKNGITIWDTDTLQPLNDTPFNGHFSSIYSVKFSRDGKILASGGLDGSIILWDTTTYQPKGDPLQAHTNGVWSIAFSPDNKLMASGSVDTTIILWDLDKKRQVGEPLKGHTQEVVSIDFSPDGKTLASGSSDGTINLWDVETHKSITTLHGHTGGVWGVAFSPDGKILATASPDKTIVLWDMDKLEADADPLTGHTNAVRCIAFSPDGKTLASGGYDNSVILWDVVNHEMIKKFTDFNTGIFSVAFNLEGTTLAAASSDGQVTLLDLNTNEVIGQPFSAQDQAVVSLAYSPDGKTLASGSTDASIVLWDLSNEEKPQNVSSLRGHPGRPTGMAFSQGGKYLISYGVDGTVLIDLISQSLTGPLDYQALSTDDQIMAYQTEESTSAKPAIGLMDMTEGKQFGKPIVGAYYYLSNDGQLLITSEYESETNDYLIGLWNTKTGSQIGDFIQGSYPSVSSDGKVLVTSQFDPETGETLLSLWNTKTGSQIGNFIKGSYQALSADGKFLVTSQFDPETSESIIGLWDAHTGSHIRDLSTKGSFTAIASDGKFLVTLYYDPETDESTIGLWNTHTGSQIGEFIKGSFLSIASDDNVLVTSQLVPQTDESMIGLWNTSTGKQIGDFVRGSFRAMSSDDKILEASVIDKETGMSVIGLWDTSTATQIGDFVKDSVMAISPDSKFMLFQSSGDLIGIRELQTWSLGNRVKDSSVNTESAAISSDNKMIAWYAGEDIVLQEIDGQRIGKSINVPEQRKNTNLSFSHDNKLLAYCDEINQTTLWNLDTQKPTGPSMPGCSPVFSPDGKFLALSNPKKGTTSLWGLSPSLFIEEIIGLRASFSNNGKDLVIVELYSRVTGSESVALQNATPTATLGSASSNTQNATPTATPGTNDQGQTNKIVFWDIGQTPPVKKREEVIPCSGSDNPDELCVNAIFNPVDQSMLIYSNGSQIFMWNYDDEKLPTEPDITAPANITKLYFIDRGQDLGQYLIVEDINDHSTIWDLNTNSLVGEPIAGKFQLSNSNPKGNPLLYIDDAGNLILWDLNTNTWIKQLCLAARRDFNEKEWNRYFAGEAARVTCP